MVIYSGLDSFTVSFPVSCFRLVFARTCPRNSLAWSPVFVSVFLFVCPRYLLLCLFHIFTFSVSVHLQSRYDGRYDIIEVLLMILKLFIGIDPHLHDLSSDIWALSGEICHLKIESLNRTRLTMVFVSSTGIRLAFGRKIHLGFSFHELIFFSLLSCLPLSSIPDGDDEESPSRQHRPPPRRLVPVYVLRLLREPSSAGLPVQLSARYRGVRGAYLRWVFTAEVTSSFQGVWFIGWGANRSISHFQFSY